MLSCHLLGDQNNGGAQCSKVVESFFHGLSPGVSLSQTLQLYFPQYTTEALFPIQTLFIVQAHNLRIRLVQSDASPST